MSPQKKETPGQFQKGYHAVPISEADKNSALRLCAVVREAPDPVAGVFLLLRDTLEASIYLGGLLDAGGYVHHWIELWIQNVNNLETTLESHREVFTNHLLDERWKRRAAFLGRLDRSDKIEMSFETAHPLPIYFDLTVSGPVTPKDAASSSPWELCVDDRLLEEHGLPRYSTSLARYLYLRETSKPPFLPVTVGCPENEATQQTRQTLGPRVPLNRDGGLMLARKFAPLSFENSVDLIGGQPWKGLEEGSKVFRLTGVYRTLQNAEVIQQGGGHLFLGRQGRAGRLIETFHLKLDLLLQAFRLVREFVRDEQLPFLNLSAESFRVRLAETSQNLPFLWTARVTLSTLGSAFALPIETSDARYFLAPDVNTTSIYSPITPSAPISSAGAVRIRKVHSADDDTFVLEGTIFTQERIAISQTDLLWLRLTLSSGRVDFYANLTEGVAHGERRFRTLPQKLPEHIGLAIRSAEGVRFPNAPFETLPMRSSPCDLHALATIGIRTLLVNEENTLPIALDEVFSLAQAVAADAQEGFDVSKRLREVCATDPRWSASLGPHRLLNPQSLTAEESMAYLPAELWWDSIALLIQCFPGLVPGAFCADLGDAPPLALHSVFEPAIEALEKLSLRARSVLFVDWKYNAEIKSVVQAALQRHLTELS
ncbi:MAG: hypothetical protein WBX20_18165 [Terrimicrobiaceae bacterium]